MSTGIMHSHAALALLLCPCLIAAAGSGILAIESPANLHGWTHGGCFSDADAASQALLGPTFSSGKVMTQGSCVGFCRTRGFSVAGLRAGTTCTCGHAPDRLAAQATLPNTACDSPCTGQRQQACGGRDRLSVFFRGAGPVTNPGPDGALSLGCFADGLSQGSSGQRTLSTAVATQNGGRALTVARCVAACRSKGYGLAGVMDGNACYCDSQIRHAAEPLPAGRCSDECPGNYSEVCGGPGALNIYRISAAEVAVQE